MKKPVIFIFLLLSAVIVNAQSLITYNQGPSYYMVERSDIRRYDNGKFTGLTSREVRSFISSMNAPSNAASAVKQNSWFSGHFYVLEETKSNMQKTSKGLSGSIPSTFHIAPDGKMTVVDDNGFPSYRSFPSYPSKAVLPGESWRSEAVRSVDPYNTGIYTKMPIYIEYVFSGEETYKGEQVYRIKAKWATRYGVQYMDYYGDPNLKSASGTHNADILVLKDTGAAILIRDTMDETFTYKDGSSVRLAGSTLLFTEFPPAVNKEKLYTALKSLSGQDAIASSGELKPQSGTDILPLPSAASGKTPEGSSLTKSSGKESQSAIKSELLESVKNGDRESVKNEESGSINKKDLAASLHSGLSSGQDSSAADENNTGVFVEQLDTGIRLSVRDIRFASDSAVILSEEKWRLDEIAKVLLLVPDSFFLVEGHTAATGNPSGEKKLSIERAKKIISEMAARGIAEERFLYAGYGAENPIADNSTSEGKAKNRRVEITILE